MPKSHTMLQSAGQALRHGNLVEAEAILSDILSSDASNTSALSTLAKLKRDSGDKAAALAIYRKLLKIDPGSEDAVVNLVNYHGVHKEFSQCELILRKAISHAPQMTRYHFMLGNLLLQQGYHWQAIEQMQVALDIEPENLQVQVALAEIYGRRGDMDLALDVLKPLLEVSSPHFPAFVVFSNICLALNMRDDCMKLVSRIERQSLMPQQRQQLASIRGMLESTRL